MAAGGPACGCDRCQRGNAAALSRRGCRRVAGAQLAPEAVRCGPFVGDLIRAAARARGLLGVGGDEVSAPGRPVSCPRNGARAAEAGRRGRPIAGRRSARGSNCSRTTSGTPARAAKRVRRHGAAGQRRARRGPSGAPSRRRGARSRDTPVPRHDGVLRLEGAGPARQAGRQAATAPARRCPLPRPAAVPASARASVRSTTAAVPGRPRRPAPTLDTARGAALYWAYLMRPAPAIPPGRAPSRRGRAIFTPAANADRDAA